MPPPSDPLLQQFLGLLVRVRQRPQLYCRTIGELEEIVGQLYDICATASAQEEQLARGIATELADRGLTGLADLLTDEERSQWFGPDDPLAGRLIGFWTALDTKLGFPSPPREPPPDGEALHPLF
jgi:hypothetical protein